MTGDPIATLVEGLEHSGKPSLAWVVEWSAGGREPVTAAWDASRDPWSMVQLLMRTGRDWPLGRYHLVDGRGLRKRDDGDDGMPKQYVVLGEGKATSFIQRNAQGAVEIRRRIPQPPTLQTVLATRSLGAFRVPRGV